MKDKKLDDAIAKVAYIADCLMAYRNINETGRDCNQCAAVECTYKPRPGQIVRHNCPHYVESKTEQNDSITCTNDSEIPNTSPDHIAEADKMKPFVRGRENDKDIINRQDAIRWIKTECNPYGKPTLEYETSCRIMEHLDRMTPAQPKSKRGKWINKDTRNNLYECSECGLITYSESVQNLKEFERFCSRCGARMEVER